MMNPGENCGEGATAWPSRPYLAGNTFVNAEPQAASCSYDYGPPIPMEIIPAPPCGTDWSWCNTECYFHKNAVLGISLAKMERFEKKPKLPLREQLLVLNTIKKLEEDRIVGDFPEVVVTDTKWNPGDTNNNTLTTRNPQEPVWGPQVTISDTLPDNLTSQHCSNALTGEDDVDMDYVLFLAGQALQSMTDEQIMAECQDMIWEQS